MVNSPGVGQWCGWSVCARGCEQDHACVPCVAFDQVQSHDADAVVSGGVAGPLVR